MVSEMTIDPTTSHKHTVGMIEKAMSELNYNIKSDKPAKAQALELIKRLGAEDSPLKIQRVRMRVRITMPGKDAKRCKDKVLAEVEEVEEEDAGMEWEAVSDTHRLPLTHLRSFISTHRRTERSQILSTRRRKEKAESSRWVA